MSEETQQAWSFDKTTLQKIGKGFLIAMGGALGTWMLGNVDLISSLFVQNPMLASLVTALISFVGNFLYQLSKGK